MAYWQLEEQMVPLVNERRAQGANCGSKGSFGPAPPLTVHPALRCAARKHSKDMADNNFFDHTNLMGESPGDRIDQTGYNWSTYGENIAAGNATAAATLNQWMGSDGHCANIMNPSFEHIGVGYHPGGQWGHLWTQVFGAGG
ncbi:MAG: CAP domain-containing protein [Myxococcales bacterium]|nr:CAP domain-containing protein [Myxococcales bacterium]